MNCSRFEEQLSDYLDGLLPQGETSMFAGHALQCRTCRALLDEVKAALRECKEPETVDAPVSLEASLVMIPFEDLPLDCSDFQEIITEFLDGFVPASKYHRFEQHAEACEDCSTLLTDVVYAVAACHSTHTYEEQEVPESLVDSLIGLAPAPRPSRGAALANRIAAFANYVLPSTTQGAPWSFATASTLAFATFALLLFGFSDDGTVGGIYRQAHLKAARLYSHGTELYGQKEQVVAQIERVGLDIGEVWDALGGEEGSQPEPNAPAASPQQPARNHEAGKVKESTRANN